MKHRVLWATLAGGLTMAISAPAQAETGWTRPVRTHTDVQKSDLPEIKLPEPQWTKVVDIIATDGTATVPSCGEPDVVASVRDGILRALNDKFSGISSAGGFGRMFNKIDMAPVWVHPSYSSSYVCDTQITIPEMPVINPERWKFQAYAQDGNVRVFFFDTDDQPQR